MLEAGRHGGPLRDHERKVTDHPGVRRYLTDLEEKRAPYGLWSLVQDDKLHADLVGHHDDEKGDRDPDLIVFEGPEGASPVAQMRLSAQILSTLSAGRCASASARPCSWA